MVIRNILWQFCIYKTSVKLDFQFSGKKVLIRSKETFAECKLCLMKLISYSDQETSLTCQVLSKKLVYLSFNEAYKNTSFFFISEEFGYFKSYKLLRYKLLCYKHILIIYFAFIV